MAVVAGAEKVLDAAMEWRDRCLMVDGSILSESAASMPGLWTLAHLDELDQFFVQRPDESSRSFVAKLEDQLRPVSSSAKQLAAEMLWALMLFPNNVGPSTKAELVRTVWGWSGQSLSPNHRHLTLTIARGIGSGGQAYHTYRWAELAFFIRLMRDWKRRPAYEQQRLIADPWAFCAWLDSVPESDRRQFRHMLLYLLFPETFERISSGTNKRKIVQCFQGELDPISLTPEDRGDHYGAIDRRLVRIRKMLAARYPGVDVDFYRSPVHELWNPPKPRDETVPSPPGPEAVANPGDSTDEPPPDYETPPFDRITKSIQQVGLRIDERTLRRYHLALQTRGFVILAGVSGIGKTWLAQAYADAVDAQCLVVPVAPNWTTNEDLLGYRNPLSGAYHHTEFSRFLADAAAEYARASEQGTAARPYHVVLDEMNLARVEHYFARFLSAMELRVRSGDAVIELGDGCVRLTPNLRFIGTVNVDETTHDFADKVYDRAQLIELDVPRDMLADHLAAAPYRDVIMEIWDAVRPVAPFAFRVLDEIGQYVRAATDLEVGWEELVDEQLLQKVLPRVRGTDPRLGDALEVIERIAVERFPLTHRKARHMLERFRQHGFTSYF